MYIELTGNLIKSFWLVIIRQCLSGKWFGCLANETMGRECCSQVSRCLWGGSADWSPKNNRVGVAILFYQEIAARSQNFIRRWKWTCSFVVVSAFHVTLVLLLFNDICFGIRRVPLMLNPKLVILRNGNVNNYLLRRYKNYYLLTICTRYIFDIQMLRSCSHVCTF